MTSARRLGALIALVSLACESHSVPTEPQLASPLLSVEQGTTTTVYPALDGGFGPVVLASCEEGFDLLYEQSGTVTMIETTDSDGATTRLQFVWNLTFALTNSVTGFSLSGPSHGPDRTTFAPDGSSTLVQYGLIGSLRDDGGAPLTIDAGWVEFLIDENGFSLVAMKGPHPHHEGYPERPVLCALLDQ